MPRARRKGENWRAPFSSSEYRFPYALAGVVKEYDPKLPFQQVVGLTPPPGLAVRGDGFVLPQRDHHLLNGIRMIGVKTNARPARDGTPCGLSEFIEFPGSDFRECPKGDKFGWRGWFVHLDVPSSWDPCYVQPLSVE